MIISPRVRNILLMRMIMYAELLGNQKNYWIKSQ
nr:MAG TPA: hypothetical protein [Crassvirales sp.]